VFHLSEPHPRSGFPVTPATENYLLFGDETALPAIGGILGALPAHASARVFVEVANPAEQQPLTSAAALTVTWLHREAQAPASRRRLVDAVKEVELPAGATEIWVAAESAEVIAIRRHLLKERGIDRSTLHAAGYWKRGEADHRDEEADA
jgi:NADPH-dependent ferric siderophore reductase